MPLSSASEYFKERLRHPFWIGFAVSWCLLNWQLFIVAIFESERMNVQFVSDHVQGKFFDWWLLFLIILGFLNALLSHSAKEAMSAATIFIFNKTKGLHMLWSEETFYTKLEYDSQASNAKHSALEVKKLLEREAELNSEKIAIEERVQLLELGIQKIMNLTSNYPLAPTNRNIGADLRTIETERINFKQEINKISRELGVKNN